MTPEQAIETLRETCDSYDALNVLVHELERREAQLLALVEAVETAKPRLTELAETTRLREGLEQIADYQGEPSESHAWDSEMRSIARALLAGEPQTEKQT